MRTIAATLTVLALAGCGKDRDDPAPSFDSPWEEVAASKQTADGAFHAELGSALPGGGWFRAGDREGEDASRARLVDVEGAAWPVVHVELYGWATAADDGTGWDVLTLDVGLPAWAAGDVPLDGEAAVGRLTTVDGEVRYLVGGDLHVTDPGLEDGQIVAGWFTDAVLSEVAK